MTDPTKQEARGALAAIDNAKKPTPRTGFRVAVATSNLDIGAWGLVPLIALLVAIPAILILDSKRSVRYSTRQDPFQNPSRKRSWWIGPAIILLGFPLMSLLPDGSVPWSVGAGIVVTLLVGAFFEWESRA